MMTTKSTNQFKMTLNNTSSKKQTIIHNMIETRKRQLQSVMRILQQISGITSENINQLKKIKQNITKTLRSTIIEKNSRRTIFNILTTDNKNFLQDNYLNNFMETIVSEQLQKEIEKQKMNEFKQWIKNPQLFESYFNTKLTKENLKQILNPKYDLMRKLHSLESFLYQNGLKYKGYNLNIALIDSCNMDQFLTKLQEMINIKKINVIEKKKRILELLSYNIRNESDIKCINEYMQSFIKLYQSLNSLQPYIRFNTQHQSMKYFNFSIDQTTVVLRNPQLNHQKQYETVTYESEFAFINDGEYIFNNEYRADYLCWDEMIDVERSANTMIGSEYMMMSEEDEDCWDTQGRMVEINSYLRSDKKIFLRLRLTSVQFDKITIKLLKSTSWQSFLNSEKQSYHDFNLQIIPDEGDNRHVYGFTSLPVSSVKVPQQQSKIDQSMIKQQQTYLVLEDDVISLFLTMDQEYFVCWNETRNHLIHKISIQKSTINLIKNFSFQFQLYIGIVLYTTVSEIEIFNLK